MIKLGTLFWLVLVSMTGFAMFAVKYGVQSLEDELNRTKKATIAEEHAIRADEAEDAERKLGRSLDDIFPKADYQIMHTLLFPHDVVHIENLGGRIDEIGRTLASRPPDAVSPRERRSPIPPA